MKLDESGLIFYINGNVKIDEMFHAKSHDICNLQMQFTLKNPRDATTMLTFQNLESLTRRHKFFFSIFITQIYIYLLLNQFYKFFIRKKKLFAGIARKLIARQPEKFTRY